MGQVRGNCSCITFPPKVYVEVQKPKSVNLLMNDISPVIDTLKTGRLLTKKSTTSTWYDLDQFLLARTVLIYMVLKAKRE